MVVWFKGFEFKKTIPTIWLKKFQVQLETLVYVFLLIHVFSDCGYRFSIKSMQIFSINFFLYKFWQLQAAYKIIRFLPIECIDRIAWFVVIRYFPWTWLHLTIAIRSYRYITHPQTLSLSLSRRSHSLNFDIVKGRGFLTRWNV